MEITRRASKGFALNQVSRLAEIFLVFLFTIVAARSLGKDQFGVYSVVVSVSSLVILLSGIGFDEAVNVFMPKLREDKRRAAFLFKRLLLARTLASAVAGAVFFLVSNWLAELLGAPGLAFYFKLSSLYIIFRSISTLFVAYFMGRIDLKVVAVTRIVAGSANVILVYILLKLGYGIGGIIAVSIMVSLCVLIAYLIKTLPFLRVRGERHALLRVYHFGLALWTTAVLEYVLGKEIDIVLMKFFGTALGQIGCYNIAFTLYKALGALIITGLGGIGLSAMSEIVEKHGTRSMANAWSILTKFGMLIVLPIMIFTIAHARGIITVFYSEKFIAAAVMLRVAMFLGLPVRLIGGGTNVSVLYSLGKERIALYCRGACGISNIILDIILIPRYGAMGAIVATLVPGAVANIVEYALVRRFIGTRYPLAFAIKVVCAAIAACAFSFTAEIGTIGELLPAAFFFCLFYALFLMVLKPLSLYDGEVLSRVWPAATEWFKRWNILIGDR